MRRLRVWGGRLPTHSGGLGSRPGHYGLCLQWLDGAGEGRRKPARMASESSRLCRKRGPKVEEVAAAERREALPCASVPRRSGKQAAACYCAPFGASLPPLVEKG